MAGRLHVFSCRVEQTYIRTPEGGPLRAWLSRGEVDNTGLSPPTPSDVFNPRPGRRKPSDRKQLIVEQTRRVLVIDILSKELRLLLRYHSSYKTLIDNCLF